MKIQVSEIKLSTNFQSPEEVIKSLLGQFHCLNILPTEFPWKVIHLLQHYTELTARLYHEVI